MAIAQTAPPTEFEVASIKPFVPPVRRGSGLAPIPRRRGGPGTDDPGQITLPGVNLRTLLTTAYNVKNYQISGPAFLDTERFEIVAKVPPGATKEQVLIMWQNLLAERFQLKLHRETKEIPIYELTVGKNGPKMKESAPEPPKEAAAKSGDAPPPPPPGAGRGSVGPDGCPVYPGGRGGFSMTLMPAKMQMCASQMTMEMLTTLLAGQLDRPVFDKTGLTGKYDFKFEFAPDRQTPGMPGPMAGGGAAPGGPPDGGTALSAMMEPAPPVTAAIQSQLGLKLEAKKASAEILVIDRIEKAPTEN